jgi:DNA-binding GntR family transcriptional regulator
LVSQIYTRKGIVERIPDIGPIENRPAREQVFEVIREAIVSGRFAVGQNLPERELAASLRVSRTPLREALIMLEREGLVEIRPYRGVVVSGISRQEFLDLMELRELLEGHAARRAAERMSQEELYALLALFDGLKDRIEQGDMAAYIELNDCFHAAVAMGSGNAELGRLIASYEDRENQFIQVFSREPRLPDMLQSYREHCGVLEALQARDGEKASELMACHMRESAKRAAHLFPEQSKI